MMPAQSGRLSHTVDDAVDHAIGPPDAGITLVEYGSYACPYCRAANDRITDIRAQLGDRLRYVFRHRPVPGNNLARRAAEVAELAAAKGRFWDAHVVLMTRSHTLTEDDLLVVSRELSLHLPTPDAAAKAHARVEADILSASESGVRVTPTFFINGRLYDGVWDDESFNDALLGSLGHRVRGAALDFARWAPSSGVLLLLASVLAVAIANSPMREVFLAFWTTPLGVRFGGHGFDLSLLQWVNDGLLTIFFLVVGLEIKREFTIGHLATWRSAAMPVAAAIGGLVLPVLAYRLILWDGPWAHGWGVPMSTDTAFAVALIVMIGARVPVELRIFLTAAAIVDDIGAIVVVATFYAGELHLVYLGTAGCVTAALWLLNRLSIYKVAPYVLLGVVLWFFVHAAGLHATLAGVVLALFIPTRKPPNMRTLMSQADAVLIAEARRSGDALRAGPSLPTIQAFDAIHDRMESPGDRMLRIVSIRSSHFVLPLFALANAGVVVSPQVVGGHGPLLCAIGVGLVIGKPVGMLLFCGLAVKLRLAEKPAAYSWRQVAGAGALAGIGFTMSLFIAGEAFIDEASVAAAKIAIIGASLLAALIGVFILWSAHNPASDGAAE
jgi:Na+:H+ antiporter, NhaA family